MQKTDNYFENGRDDRLSEQNSLCWFTVYGINELGKTFKLKTVKVPVKSTLNSI